jgi:hypothetical protein
MSLQEVKLPASTHEPAPDEGYRTAAERRAEGKALRDAVPREEHGGGRPSETGLIRSNWCWNRTRGGMPDLVPIRHGRMLQSPFSFYRGTAVLMAADLAHTPNTGLRV